MPRKLPLQAGLTELSLALGDVARARAQSKWLRSLTSATAERTWTGLAHFERASVAVAGEDVATARREISRGLAAIEQYEAPLAAWRLHALAAEIDGDDDHRERAQAIVRKLADSLPQDDGLRRCFLSSRPVMRVGVRVRHADA